MTILPLREIKKTSGQTKVMPPVRVVAQALWVAGCLASGTVLQLVSNTPRG